MREYDLPVGEVLHPFRFPLERHETIVVYGCQGVHDFVDRERTFADDVVVAGIVAVAQMNVLDVGAQVVDRPGRALAFVPVRMMDVPEGGELVAREIVHQVAQESRIGIDAAGLYEDGYSALLCHRHKPGEVAADDLRSVGMGIGADIGRTHVRSEADKRLHFLEHGIILRRQVVGRVEAGDQQAAFAKVPVGCSDGVFMERSPLTCKAGELEHIIELDARETHLAGALEDVLPCEVHPSAG